MSELLKNIDARTRLAGTNKLEILLFSLGTDLRTGREETFGINVFKVREVSQTPDITKTPNMPMDVQGVISLRGNIIPVIALDKFIGRSKPDNTYASIHGQSSNHGRGDGRPDRECALRRSIMACR